MALARVKAQLLIKPEVIFGLTRYAWGGGSIFKSWGQVMGMR